MSRRTDYYGNPLPVPGPCRHCGSPGTLSLGPLGIASGWTCWVQCTTCDRRVYSYVGPEDAAKRWDTEAA